MRVTVHSPTPPPTHRSKLIPADCMSPVDYLMA